MRRIGLALAALLVAVAVLPPLAGRLRGASPPGSGWLPPRGTTIAIGGGRELNVVDVGSGPPVVLVHGLPASAADWGEVPAKLAALGYRAIAYDRIGYGYSSRDEPVTGRYTYASNAADLRALLDALGIERAVLVGWSYGGAVVQTLAREAPERVTHLVLLGPVGPATANEHRPFFDRILTSPLGMPLLTWVSSIPSLGVAITRDKMVGAFHREADVPTGFAERSAAMLALPGTLRAFVTEMQRGEPSSLRPEELRMPALVIEGANDDLMPPAVARDLQRRLPDADLVLVDGGSHMLQITHPDVVAGRIATLAARR